MKKQAVAILSAAVLTAATFTAPQPAKADISALWLIPAVIGGMWIGGAMVARPAYAFQPTASFAYASANNCWTERRWIRGRSQIVQVCLWR